MAVNCRFKYPMRSSFELRTIKIANYVKQRFLMIDQYSITLMRLLLERSDVMKKIKNRRELADFIDILTEFEGVYGDGIFVI